MNKPQQSPKQPVKLDVRDVAAPRGGVRVATDVRAGRSQSDALKS